MTEPGPHRSTDAATRPLDAVLLAGGRASRLGGASKPEQAVGGRTLLELAITAAQRAGARRIVVVGPPSLQAPGCLVVREDPPFGGPVAAIAAGLEALDAAGRSSGETHRDSAARDDMAEVLVLACDLPQAPAAVDLLLAHRTDRPRRTAAPVSPDGACLVDADDRTQWLTAIYGRAALDAAFTSLGRSPDGAAMRHLVAGLDLIEVPDEGTAEDVDTWPDLARARERADLRTSAPIGTDTRSTP